MTIVVQNDLHQQMRTKAKEGTLTAVKTDKAAAAQPKKKRRWDQPANETPVPKVAKKSAASSWDAVEGGMTPGDSRWDETPGKSKGGETPGATPGGSVHQWDLTPGHATPGAATPGRDTPGGDTPGRQVTPSARKNRWDETPKTDRGRMIHFISL